MLSDGDALQGDTDEAWDALVEAMENLRLKADKDVLEDILDEAEDLDLSLYTEESAAVFRAALANAQAVMADGTLTEDDQKTVDDAAKALSDARDQLQLKDSSGSGNTGDDGNAGGGDSENTGSGNAGTSGAKADAPKTGDSGSRTPLFGMMLAAAGAVIALRKKKI